MQKHDDLLKSLREYRQMATQADIDRFIDALQKLKKDPSSDDLPELFLVFSDDCHQLGPLWSLVSMIERFPADVYTSSLIEKLPVLVQTAPDWAEMLLVRILNDEESRQSYKVSLAKASAPQRTVSKALLSKIASEDTDFSSRVQEVLAD
jgi:hypothetical protein